MVLNLYAVAIICFILALKSESNMKRIFSILIIALVGVTTAQAQPKNQTDDNGKKHGPWEVKFEKSNTIKYTGDFEHGVPRGMFTYYFPDGKLKTESVFTSKGTENTAVMYYPSGKKMAIGKYIEKKKVGEWKFYDEQEVLRSVDFYVNGEKHGKSLYYDYDGILIKEMEYVQDIENGSVIEYYSNGKVMRTYTYDKGTKEGPSEFYFLNEKLKNKGEYKYDTKDGWWTEYLENGNIWKHERFELGELKETKMINGEFINYFENEIPATYYEYKNGKKNGSFREYYNEGRWVLEGIVGDDGQVVDKKRVLEGDQLKIAGKYFDDQLHGSIQHFSAEGKLLKVETYQKGKLVSTKEIN